MKDFARLDERFRMPDNVWSQLPQYADWSFCVFKLKPEPSAPKGFWKWFASERPLPARKRHPMAFDFPRRNPSQLFFPTVHVHDGEVHETAHFDHTLYAQLDDPSIPSGSRSGWERAQTGTEILHEPARKLVCPVRPFFRKRIEGDHPNVDVTL